MHFAGAAVPFVALFQRLLFAILVQALLQCHGLLFLLLLQLTLALQLGLLCFELLCLKSVTRSEGEKKEPKCEIGVEKVDICSHIRQPGHDDSQRFDSSAWQYVAKEDVSQQCQELHTKHSGQLSLLIQKQRLISTCTRTWM